MARKRRRRSVSRTLQRAALEALHARLVEHYGEPRPTRRLDVLDELVLTILSQNTTDTNRDRAWERLKTRFPDWESVASAPAEQVEDALAPGGLHRIKTKRIRATLATVKERRGDYDLEYLRDLDADAARAELTGIKGLGSKSVNCILLFSLGLEAFPVDTHVFRVLARLGVHRTRDLTRANDELRDALPAGVAYPLHMNVIRHGREVCHARSPRCASCSISDLCAFKGKTLLA